MFAILMLMQTPSFSVDALIQKLGRERASYGDIPNSGRWKYVFPGQFGGTTILYRAGSSTERYYVTKPDRKSGGMRISRTTRNGSEIRKDWMIELTDTGRYSTNNPGSLWKWAVKDEKATQPISAKIQRDLESLVPLAAYRVTVHSGTCFLVDQHGKDSEKDYWTPQISTKHGGMISSDYSHLPKSRDPYPISKAESAWLAKH